MSHVSPKELKKKRKLKYLNKSKSREKRYGKIKYMGFGFRGKRSQVTPKPTSKHRMSYQRGRKLAPLWGTATKPRFTIKTKAFEYLTTTPKQRFLGFPIPLGDDMIMSIDFKPSSNLIAILDTFYTRHPKKKLKPKRSAELEVASYIVLIMKWFFKQYIVEPTDKLIENIVPIMSGRLQEGMKQSLKDHKKFTRLPIHIRLNTMDKIGNPIYYANPVNNMQIDWLMHPAPWHRNTRTIDGITYFLNDPGARTGWYDETLAFARRQAIGFYGRLYQELIKQFGVPYAHLIYNRLEVKYR